MGRHRLVEQLSGNWRESQIRCTGFADFTDCTGFHRLQICGYEQFSLLHSNATPRQAVQHSKQNSPTNSADLLILVDLG